MTTGARDCASSGHLARGLGVRQISDGDREMWNAFVGGHPAGNYMQTYEWGEVRRASGWRPWRLAVVAGSDIVACAQVLEKRLPLGAAGIHYAPRGPVVDYRNHKLVAAALDALRADLAGRARHQDPFHLFRHGTFSVRGTIRPAKRTL